ncbi:MAG TPA: glycosyl hydrolase, partial [Prolixibacteraceae bacterium]|nr:glycosyl hydrolase [Prolixibacteraceae bacterium]
MASLLKTVFLCFSLFLIFLLTGSSSCKTADSGKQKFSRIESGFKNIPDSIQTSVYWYWISDNISKEGVVNDLHAMKKAGINRAFIGNIGLDNVPYGKVKMLSDEWWEIVHAALKTATELNIEIGIFNSPGWSQSGGPWVETSEAMRYLTTSRLQVNGPRRFTGKLALPDSIFQDVKVIAYPVSESDQMFLTGKNGKVVSSTGSAATNLLFDGDTKTGIPFPPNQEIVLDFYTDSPFTARSLSVTCTPQPMLANAELWAQGNDGEFKSVSTFVMNRSNPALHVGFVPYAPVVITLPAIDSRHFRLQLKNTRKGGGIAEVELSAGPRVERYSEKTLAKMHPTPLPYWADYLWRVQPETDNSKLAVDPATVKDISSFMTPDGTLNWDVPEGNWEILRTGMTPTGTKNSPASPEATGYEVDKMSKQHVEKHFYGHMG